MSAGARAVLHESSRRPWTGKVRPRGGSKTLLVSYRPLAIPGIIESGLQKQDIAAPMAKHRESNKAKPPAKKQPGSPGVIGHPPLGTPGEKVLAKKFLSQHASKQISLNNCWELNPPFGPKTKQQCVDLFAAELGEDMDWDEQVAVAKLSQHCGEGTMPLPMLVNVILEVAKDGAQPSG